LTIGRSTEKKVYKGQQNDRSKIQNQKNLEVEKKNWQTETETEDINYIKHQDHQ
jgi:hypothetical protein